MLRQLIRRLGGDNPRALPAPHAPLIPASELLPRFRAQGSGRDAALALTEAQLDALRHLIATADGWARVRELVARAGDPWNAHDWPDGFDPLMLCAALCDDVAFECVRCPVGERQGGFSCAHPRSLFGHVLPLIGLGDRPRLLAHLEDIRAVLHGRASWDVQAARRQDD